eukprot:scaffold9914_cov80-Skeletonema_dohrnii-CCMP3373.AAC.1
MANYKSRHACTSILQLFLKCMQSEGSAGCRSLFRSQIWMIWHFGLGALTIKKTQDDQSFVSMTTSHTKQTETGIVTITFFF